MRVFTKKIQSHDIHTWYTDRYICWCEFVIDKPVYYNMLCVCIIKVTFKNELWILNFWIYCDLKCIHFKWRQVLIWREWSSQQNFNFLPFTRKSILIYNYYRRNCKLFRHLPKGFIIFRRLSKSLFLNGFNRSHRGAVNTYNFNKKIKLNEKNNIFCQVGFFIKRNLHYHCVNFNTNY